MSSQPDFEEHTRTIRRWLNRQTVPTDRLVDELAFWRDYMQEPVLPPTPAPGQIWGRSSGAGLTREVRHIRVEAFVPETSLGALVVFTFCGLTPTAAHVEHVETFLRRSTFVNGGTV